jgi:hypothetical protein
LFGQNLQVYVLTPIMRIRNAARVEYLPNN